VGSFHRAKDAQMTEQVTETVRHKASIAGYVADAVTGLPVPGAVVTVTEKNLRATTRSDGFFYFLDLEAGSYTLNVSAPLAGSRYGVVEAAGIRVQNAPDGRAIIDPKATIATPPTKLTGTVTQSSDGTAVKGAVVQLLGSQSKAVSDKDGKYFLTGITAGSPNVQASVPGFVTTVQKATLTAGQETMMNFSLVKS
jgi:hypothetical protein